MPSFFANLGTLLLVVVIAGAASAVGAAPAGQSSSCFVIDSQANTTNGYYGVDWSNGVSSLNGASAAYRVWWLGNHKYSTIRVISGNVTVYYNTYNSFGVASGVTYAIQTDTEYIAPISGSPFSIEYCSPVVATPAPSPSPSPYLLVTATPVFTPTPAPASSSDLVAAVQTGIEYQRLAFLWQVFGLTAVAGLLVLVFLRVRQ